eukprot:3920492-Pyramimonas_sp.AAC.1
MHRGMGPSAGPKPAARSRFRNPPFPNPPLSSGPTLASADAAWSPATWRGCQQPRTATVKG